MTAEEIRKMFNNVVRKVKEKNATLDVDVTTLAMLEIAAQLAELNASLLRIFNAENPAKGARLTIDKLD